MQILGYEISDRPASEIVQNALQSPVTQLVNTINPHSYVVAKSDAAFQQALRESDVLVPDGSGIVLAAKLLQGKAIDKVSGMDCFYAAMHKLQETAGSVLFFGSTDVVLDKLAARAATEFPAVTVKTFSPPFKTVFDEADLQSFRGVITEAGVDVVFFGLTAPKQEKLAHSIGRIDGVKMMSGIGAVFDFYAGTVKRPADFWIRLHLEWLVRLLGEPRRLWRRNFVSTPIFLIDLLRARFRLT